MPHALKFSRAKNWSAEASAEAGRAPLRTSMCFRSATRRLGRHEPRKLRSRSLRLRSQRRLWENRQAIRIRRKRSVTKPAGLVGRKIARKCELYESRARRRAHYVLGGTRRRFLWHVASWGIRFPMTAKTAKGLRCQFMAGRRFSLEQTLRIGKVRTRSDRSDHKDFNAPEIACCRNGQFDSEQRPGRRSRRLRPSGRVSRSARQLSRRNGPGTDIQLAFMLDPSNLKPTCDQLPLFGLPKAVIGSY
jgi:hypothetical protein